MCGIFGYIGMRNASEIVLNGLKSLEYRGYDSWGICALDSSHKLQSVKNVGKISDAKGIKLPAGNIAIAHTRWATHGKVNVENSHPHFCCNRDISIVHNGIIENYKELKLRLEETGHSFTSETDTEVIAHLIEENFRIERDFLIAVQKSLNILDGTFALVVLNRNEKRAVCARFGSPLVMGVCQKDNQISELFFSSDSFGMLEFTKDVIFLDDCEAAVVDFSIKGQTHGYELFNFSTGARVKKDVTTLDYSGQNLSKGEYKHFMFKEICEQPATTALTFSEYAKKTDSGYEIKFENFSSIDFKSINKITIVACGTSYYAGFVSKYIFEKLLGIEVDCDYASEFKYAEPIVSEKTLVIAITQSGETADTLGAVREAKKRGAKVLSIVNVVGSTIARDSDYVIYTKAGPEIGVASTKAFTSQLMILYLIAMKFAKAIGRVSVKKMDNFLSELSTVPDLISRIIDKNDEILAIAKKYFLHPNFLYLGRNLNYPVALEGALKLKEISYIHAEGQSAAEMKHGPIALIDQNMPTVFLAVKDKLYPKIVSNMEEVKARGGKIIAIVSEKDERLRDICDDIVIVPSVSEQFYPLLTVVPLQMLAYHIANLRMCDIDKPKNLAKSVTVE